MRAEVFAAAGVDIAAMGGDGGIRSVLHAVAEGTDHDKLVVAVYLLDDATTWRGVTYNSELTPQAFCHGRKTWKFTKGFGIPAELPPRYGLIRMAFGVRAAYPRTQSCRYGWEYRIETFESSLALIFAHELHHYRRHHLGLHPRQGEQSACKWGLMRARAAGFHVEAKRVSSPPRSSGREEELRVPKAPKPRFLNRIKTLAGELRSDDVEALQDWLNRRLLSLRDAEDRERRQAHYSRLRAMKQGTELSVSRKARDRYSGESVVKVRNLRASERMVVRTRDGKLWRYPMLWLDQVGRNIVQPK